MIKFFSILLILTIPIFSIQSQSISTLEKRLEKSEGLTKVKTLNKLSKAYMKKDLQKSIDYGKQALKMAKNVKAPDKLKADIYNNLGAAYFFSGNYKTSVNNYESELNLIKKTSDSRSIACSYYNIAIIYEKTGKNNKAQKNFDNSLEYADKTNDVNLQATIYKSLSVLNEHLNNDAGALKNLKGYLRLMDKNYQKNRNILMNEIVEEKEIVEELEKISEEKEKQIDSLNVEKKLIEQLAEKNNELFKREEEINKTRAEMRKAEIEKQEYREIIMISVIAFLLIITFFVVRSILQKRKSNRLLLHKNSEIQQQKEEIETQNNVLSTQKIELEESNKHITQSITYAKRIQKAVIRGEDILEETFSQHFILFKPKDIVSGDFFWVKKIKDFTIVVAADCTGHGVPGAFMSMLGISLLNQTVTTRRLDNPGEILNILRKKIKTYLHQTGEYMESKDGMDLSFLLINTETLEAQYAGANNSIYLIRDEIFLEYKPTRNPIGIHHKEIDFETHVIQLQKDDSLYLFSDGYADQFGGEDGKKLKSRQFKKILTDNVNTQMSTQKEVLTERLEQWQGDNEQIDDILVMGLKL